MRSGFVSLIGRPNAGKSTLLNLLVGTKLAIVSDKPQTTRNRIVGVKNIQGDQLGQIVFVDTPGIHRPLHRLNVRMVDLAIDTVRFVDLLVIVLDSSEDIGSGDRYLLGLFDKVSIPVILALNKIDLITKTRLLPMMDWYQQQREFKAIIPISAKTGDGVEKFVSSVVSTLPEGEPLYAEDYLTDQPDSVFVGEVIREKLLRHTRAELPFSTAVVVDRFEEADDAKIIRLYCSILVERSSQKAIVIGRQGSLIKKIGTEARQELEKFFATTIFLDLRVSVRSGWREDGRILDQLGLNRRS
tara:strand:+ start:18546 stop:19445 length:900 start_codon:yes stop_codon:yes gene_type:complete